MNAPDSSPSIVAAHELIRSLVQLGVREIVLAPGSRSAPLAYAAAYAARVGSGGSTQVRLHVRVDERDAGFLALGLARAGQLAQETTGVLAAPVAVITTSGTAVANLHPAVLESHHGCVPLLLLTADRPHELRGTGANQTTDQVGVFAAATRLTVDVPAPSGRAGELRDLRALTSRAVAAASGSRSLSPGPVHLNLSFRDPLAPSARDLEMMRAPMDRDLADALDSTPAAAATSPNSVALADVVPRVAEPGDERLAGLAQEPRTVVIAGDGAGPTARALAEARGWPLLAEVSSGAAGGPNLIRAHRVVLGTSPLTAEVRQVIVLGRPTVSRPVQQLLARADVRVCVVAPGAEQWPDAARNAAVVLDRVPASWLVAELAEPTPRGVAEPTFHGVAEPTFHGVAEPTFHGVAEPTLRGGFSWLTTWRGVSGVVGERIDRELATGAGSLTALTAAAEIARACAPTDVLVVGSSSPVRDLEIVAGWHEPPTVIANRGLAGIDGTVSTALGVALGVQRARGTTDGGPSVRALMGDLTFLHDVGGLLRGPSEPEPHVQIVVINDRGGAIFSTLEYGLVDGSEVFERVFATPHAANLGALCAGYAVPHTAVEHVEQLRELLAEPSPGVSVVEVRVGRADRAQQEQALRGLADIADS